MAKPMVRIYTTADEFIDREMNDEEYLVHQKFQEFVAKEQAEAQAKAEARAALLERLGITADEAKLLLA